MGELDRAITDVTESIRLDRHPRAYRFQTRGEIYTKKGEFARALIDLNEAIRLDPKHAFRFHSRGVAYTGAGDLTRAIADFTEAIRLDLVKRGFRFYARANAFRDTGRYGQAISDYNEVLTLEPTNGWALLDRGRAFAKSGQSDLARRDYEAARRVPGATPDLQQAAADEIVALPSSRAQPPLAKSSSGTGFFVNAGLVLTNNHVIKDCGSNPIFVSYPERRPERAYVSAQDDTNDLALLQTNLPSTAFASFRIAPRLGEPVATFGFPLSGLLSSGGNFSQGNVTSLAGIGDDTRLLQTSTPIQPGNSGGPLLDMTGAVIGVIESQLNAVRLIEITDNVPQNVNFAIRSAIVVNFLGIKGVSPKLNEKERQTLEPADVANLAKSFTVRVRCELGS